MEFSSTRQPRLSSFLVSSTRRMSSLTTFFEMFLIKFSRLVLEFLLSFRVRKRFSF